MTALRRAAVLLAFLGSIAGPAAARAAHPDAGSAGEKGGAYTSDDLTAHAPGRNWYRQDTVRGAANIRAAYVLPGTENGKDHSSLITFAVDPAPTQSEPLAYLRAGARFFEDPPLSFRLRKAGSFKIRDGVEGGRADFVDKEQVRCFTQIAMRTPAGGILVVALQSPDAAAYGNDLPALIDFVHGIEFKAPRTPPKGPAPVPAQNPKSKH